MNRETDTLTTNSEAVIRLKRSLGVVALTFYGIGVILGAGIYSIVGVAAGEAGYSLWLSFLISSVAVFLTALSYAEMSALYPEAGAEYIYLRKAFPEIPWLGFITGILIALSAAATATTVVVAFVGYLSAFIPTSTPLIAILLLTLLSGVSVVGVRESSWVNIVFTLLELAGLIVFIWVGFQHPEFATNLFSKLHMGVFSGSALVFFAYLGFENICALAEETKNPGRTLPQAILASLFFTSLVYILVGISAVALLPPEKLASSSSPLTTALLSYSPTLAKSLGGIALFATANTALVSIIAAARIFFSIARMGELPLVFSKTLKGRHTPWAATLLTLMIAVLLLPLGGIEVIAGFSSLAALLAFSSVNLAVIALRYRRPKEKRPFRVPFTVGRTPVLCVLGLLINLALLTQFHVTVYWAALGVLCVSLILFALMRKK